MSHSVIRHCRAAATSFVIAAAAFAAAGCASPRAEPTELLVLAESGRPVAGVPVSWHERWGERRGFACVDKGVSGQCLTDEQGRAELPALEPGHRREVKIVLPANP